MKFCTSCGAQLNDDTKFCTSCGAPVQQAAAPAQQAAPVQQTAPVQPAAPKEPKPKKNLKVPIILGSIGLVVIIGIIVFFTVFFPEMVAKHIKMSDFVTAKFSNSKYVDGNISGYLTLDLDKAYKACVDDRNKCSSYKFSDYFRYFNESFSEKSAKDTVEAKFNVIKDGEFKEGDYKLKLEGFQGSEWDTSGEFTISKDDTVLATVYVYSESSSAKDKSQVNITLSYSSDYNDDTLIYDTAIRVASKSKKYDVTAQKGVTLDEAKKNIDTLIKKTEKDNKSSSYNIDVVSSYLLTAKDKDEENQNLIINIYCQTYKKDSKYKYYYTDGFKNCYIDTYETDKESQFKFEDDYYSSWSSSSSENEALRDIKTDYQKDYTIQKIK